MVLGIRRGMVFRVEITERDSKGIETFRGVNEPAPYVVLSRDSVHRNMPLALAAPLTTKVEKAMGAAGSYRITVEPEHVTRYADQSGVRGLDAEPRVVLTEQLRVIAHERLLENPIAQFDEEALAAVEAGLLYVLAVGV
jgi:mRNA-degrading endonuclease toxin of MazEF toxin-antitoxin module